MSNTQPADPPVDAADILRLGTVASVDLAGGMCTVTCGDLETGPIRWAERSMGATRSWSPPSIGEQVMLLCPEGEIEAGIALRGVACDDNPHIGNSAREIIAQYTDGALLAYDPEAHHFDITLPAGATLTINADGGLNIVGDITLTGKLTASDDVIASGKSLKNHHHSGVQTGGGQTGAPV